MNAKTPAAVAANVGIAGTAIIVNGILEVGFLAAHTVRLTGKGIRLTGQAIETVGEVSAEKIDNTQNYIEYKAEDRILRIKEWAANPVLDEETAQAVEAAVIQAEPVTA